MRVGNRDTLLRLLDSKMAHMLDMVIDQAHEDGSWVSSHEAKVEITRRVGISQPTFFRYLKTLASKGILVALPMRGRGVYKLNHEMMRTIT
jgi:DNA-binding IscR family transcriptional regulator